MHKNTLLIKRHLAIALAAVMCLSQAPAAVYADESAAVSLLDVADVSFSLSSDGKTLTISGSGAMQEDLLNSLTKDEMDQVTQAVIGEGVTSLPDYALASFGNLTQVSIPSTVTAIGYEAFAYSGLTSVNIPAAVTSIGDEAFEGCSNLTSITVSSGNTAYTASGNVLYNKDKTKLICCPGGMTGTLTVPTTVQEIGDYAVYGCENLTSVVMSAGVTLIGYGAFGQCISLTSVTIPATVEEIYGAAFSSCISLAKITLPAGLEYIDEETFENCASLASVNIPASVNTIGFEAFSDCSSLTSIEIPAGLQEIYENAFENCVSLKTVTIPSGSVLDYIGANAFSDCLSLESFTLPASVELFDAAFAGCTALKNFAIASGNETYVYKNGAVYTSDMTTLVEYIQPGASSAEVPSTVTDIAGYAFSGCSSLTKIGLPKSLVYIDESAFFNCGALNDVYYAGTQSEFGSIEIGDNNDDLTGCTFHYSASLSDAGKPAAPVLKSVANGVSGVLVKWGAVDGATAYRIFRKTEGGSWKGIRNVSSATTGISDTTAVEGTTYYYTVRAYAGSTAGNYDTTGLSVKRLAQPTVKAAASATGVKVTWNQITGADSYSIYRKAAGGSWKGIKSISGSTLGTSGGSFIDTTAVSGTTYYYTVKAVSGTSASTFVTNVSLLYLSQPTVALSNAADGIGIRWTKSGGAVTYRIYRKTGSGSYAKLKDVAASTITGNTGYYVDTTAAAGTTYNYTVRALKGSSASSFVTTKTIICLAAPALQSITIAAGSVSISWSQSTGADGYYVYRKTGSGSWKLISKISSQYVLYYQDTTAVSGTSYSYTIRAYKGSTLSAYDTTGLTATAK